MNGAGDEDPAPAVDHQSSVIVGDIGAKRRRSKNSDRQKRKNQQLLRPSHGQREKLFPKGVFAKLTNAILEKSLLLAVHFGLSLSFCLTTSQTHEWKTNQNQNVGNGDKLAYPEPDTTRFVLLHERDIVLVVIFSHLLQQKLTLSLSLSLESVMMVS